MCAGYELVLAFDRDEEAFARGVEVGILHARLRTGPLPVVAMMHATNLEMALRLAETHCVSAQSDGSLGDWVTVTFS